MGYTRSMSKPEHATCVPPFGCSAFCPAYRRPLPPPRTVSVTDYRSLDEDVRTHTLARFYTHDDGRVCGWHARLEKWVISAANAECQRKHDDTEHFGLIVGSGTHPGLAPADEPELAASMRRHPADKALRGERDSIQRAIAEARIRQAVDSWDGDELVTKVSADSLVAHLIRELLGDKRAD